MSGKPHFLSMLDILELFSFHTMSGHFVRFELLIDSLRVQLQKKIIEHVQVKRIRQYFCLA